MYPGLQNIMNLIDTIEMLLGANDYYTPNALSYITEDTLNKVNDIVLTNADVLKGMNKLEKITYYSKLRGLCVIGVDANGEKIDVNYYNDKLIKVYTSILKLILDDLEGQIKHFEGCNLLEQLNLLQSQVNKGIKKVKKYVNVAVTEIIEGRLNYENKDTLIPTIIIYDKTYKDKTMGYIGGVRIRNGQIEAFSPMAGSTYIELNGKNYLTFCDYI